MSAVSEDRVPLFVRLPAQQAAALDRLVGSTGRRKQQLVSDLLADQLTVGKIEIMESARSGGEEVLTLDEAAALLRLPAGVIRARAVEGEMPGRLFGEEWRFSRPALLAWLASPETSQREPGAQDDNG